MMNVLKPQLIIILLMCACAGMYVEVLRFNLVSLSESIDSSITKSRELRYAHDDPSHPWHWTRENEPSPEMSKKVDCDEKSYADLYDQFHEEGWVIFTSCSLQQNMETIIDRVAKYTAEIDGNREDSAKIKEVKDLASDPDTLKFLEYIHGGRSPFPFQTLNFPVGTEQTLHSDLIHFDTMPRTLMTAGWVALEDMSEDNGPLRFYPKSHKYGTWDYAEVGMSHKHEYEKRYADEQYKLQVEYGDELESAMEKLGLEKKVASEIKKGQTFFWAAGLIHGGSEQNNKELSRLSQVTHYFFEGSTYYWVPRFSLLNRNEIFYINKDFLVDCAPQHNLVDGTEEFHSCAEVMEEKFRKSGTDVPGWD